MITMGQNKSFLPEGVSVDYSAMVMKCLAKKIDSRQVGLLSLPDNYLNGLEPFGTGLWEVSGKAS